MKNFWKLLVFFSLSFPSLTFPQLQITPHPNIIMQDELSDKCQFDQELAVRMQEILGSNWGYGYDSLLIDLERWRQSPYVIVDSIGASVQNRAIWQLTITANHPPSPISRKTIFIHARTHPSEVQAFWITNEIIRLLTSEDPLAQFARENCIFYIIPMYNPDGVELGYPRENAHGIDLERNWTANPMEPESAALKNRFLELMNSPAPIEVALNMHASSHTKRFFYYHDSAGTSYQYTLLEKDFINAVRSYFINGFEPWYYHISWTTGTVPYFPEGWFWINYAEAVMALTYEDTNIMVAGAYDTTAYALVHGVIDYLGLVPTPVHSLSPPAVESPILYQNFPNPFNNATTISFYLPQPARVEVKIYDLLGKKVKTLANDYQNRGLKEIIWHGDDDSGHTVGSGIYILHLTSGNFSTCRQLVFIK